MSAIGLSRLARAVVFVVLAFAATAAMLVLGPAFAESGGGGGADGVDGPDVVPTEHDFTKGEQFRCDDLGYEDFGARDLLDQSATLVGDVLVSWPFVMTSGGETFDVIASRPVLAAVIVKGGTTVLAYDYLGDLGHTINLDDGLHAPLKQDGSRYRDVSHIDFCFVDQLEVAKTAEPMIDRHVDWTIAKVVVPESTAGFAADRFDLHYEVTATKHVTMENPRVEGTITVTNPTPFEVEVTIQDFMVTTPLGAVMVMPVCPTTIVEVGDQLACAYNAALPEGTISGWNTTVVAVEGPTGVHGAMASASFDMADAAVVATGEPDEIMVDDSIGGTFGPTSQNDTFAYTHEVACPTEAADYVDGVRTDAVHNTAFVYVIGEDASIVETGDEASADVDLVCYLPSITKSVEATYGLSYDWTIDKQLLDATTGDWVDEGNVSIVDGDTGQLSFEIELLPTEGEVGHRIGGSITVVNPHPTAELTVEVTDQLTADGSLVAVDCGDGSAEMTIPPGESVMCSYGTDVDSQLEGSNTATATWTSNAGATESVSTTVDLSWQATASTGECVQLTDSLVPDVDGERCFDEAAGGVITIPYEIAVACPGAPELLVNGATLLTDAADPSTVVAEDAVEIAVTCVPLVTGCTHTIGYWRNHADPGSARYDPIWEEIGPDGPDTEFRNSGMSYLEVLSSPPRGDVWFILARQYIAAELNMKSGASKPTEVAEAMAAALELLQTNEPGTRIRGEHRDQFVELAELLDAYNNGIVGPGHCDSLVSDSDGD